MFNGEKLINYVSKYSESREEYIIKTILDNNEIRSAMDTEIGQVIFKRIISKIDEGITTILEICRDDKQDIRRIQEAASEINYSFRMLRELALIINADINKKEGE